MKHTVVRLGRFFFLSLAVLLFFTQLGYSQGTMGGSYPSRPITFIVPLPPGSTADLAPRLIAKEAEKFLGQPIIIVNKPGAGTTIGIAAIASAKPDGYTIGYASPSGMLVAPFIENLPYHPLNDFQEIIQFSEANFGVTVRADSPFKTFKDIIDYARNNPEKLTYGTKGVQDIANIPILQVAKKQGVQLTLIPFKGGPEIMAALLGGHIDIGVGDFNYSLLDAGKIRLLVLLGEKHRPEYPQTPIIKELGYGPDILAAPVFFNIAGPRGIPADIVKRLEDAFTKAISEQGFIDGLKSLRFSIVYRDSKEMSNYMAHYYTVYGKLLKEMGLSRQQ